MKERVQITPHCHVWEGDTRNKIVSWLGENAWRLQGTLAHDDLEQEAYIIWMKCAKTYSHITGDKHFYSLFHRAVSRFVIDQTRRQHLVLRVGERFDVGDDFDVARTARDHISESEFKLLVEDAPEDVREALYRILVESKSASRTFSRAATKASPNLRERCIKWYEGVPQTV